MVASSQASCMFSDGTTKVARVTLVFASHCGRGKLPMLVVARGGSCMWGLRCCLSCSWLPDQLLGGGDDLVDAGQEVLFEGRTERHRHGRKVEPLGGLL